jgi:ABC-type transport system substrate-binding protein
MSRTETATDYVWTLVATDDTFNHPAVRGALAFGIDEAAITRLALEGRGEFRAADSAFNTAPYSVERARALLKEAQYNGQTAVIVPDDDDDLSRKLAEYMQDYLTRIDIPAIIVNNQDSRTTITIGSSD